MLLNDRDISRLMVYAQQIEESKLKERNRDGKRPRVDEPSQSKPNKRFYNQDSFMENKDRVSNKNSQGGVMLMRGLSVLVVGSNTWVDVFPALMVSLDVVIGVII